MKKIMASVLSVLLAASAFIPVSGTGLASASENQQVNNIEIERGYYADFFDEDLQENVSWYTLYRFASDQATAVIPCEVNGNIISDIARGACDCTGIENLFLPKKVKLIADKAFKNTESLKYLTIPENVTQIGDIDLPENITIRGYQGTFAQAYANKKGYAFEAMGDADANGSISVSDLMFVRKYLLNTSTEMTPDQQLMSDYNMDGTINILDYIMVAHTLMNDTSDMFANPNISAVAAPDYSKAQRTGNYKNEAFNEFTAKTVSTLFKDSKEANEMCSPLSLYMALSQAAECSDNNTRQQFLDTLGASSLEELRTSNSSLFGSLYYDELSRYMKIANSMWINNKFELEQEPLDILAEDYYAAVFKENFEDSDAAADKISKWISDNTGGKFKPDIDIDPDHDILKIINTVNFKDAWCEKFDPATDDTFTLDNGSEETCQFLKKFYENATADFADNYTMFSVNMKDDYKMNFVLPDVDSSVEEIISDSDTLEKMFNGDYDQKTVNVNFSVPKFNVKSKYDFIPTAKKLGITDSFEASTADFSRIFDSSKNHNTVPTISQISHEAALQINEEGCEAAAYTMICMKDECVPMQSETIDFDLDRPFICYVSDTNGTPVFMGVISDPSEQ